MNIAGFYGLARLLPVVIGFFRGGATFIATLVASIVSPFLALAVALIGPGRRNLSESEHSAGRVGKALIRGAVALALVFVAGIALLPFIYYAHYHQR